MSAVSTAKTEPLSCLLQSQGLPQSALPLLVSFTDAHMVLVIISFADAHMVLVAISAFAVSCDGWER
jgi:hypothetical protein